MEVGDVLLRALSSRSLNLSPAVYGLVDGSAAVNQGAPG